MKLNLKLKKDDAFTIFFVVVVVWVNCNNKQAQSFS